MGLELVLYFITHFSANIHIPAPCQMVLKRINSFFYLWILITGEKLANIHGVNDQVKYRGQVNLTSNKEINLVNR